jgi:hypothetical protein
MTTAFLKTNNTLFYYKDKSIHYKISTQVNSIFDQVLISDVKYHLISLFKFHILIEILFIIKKTVDQLTHVCEKEKNLSLFYYPQLRS